MILTTLHQVLAFKMLWVPLCSMRNFKVFVVQTGLHFCPTFFSRPHTWQKPHKTHVTTLEDNFCVKIFNPYSSLWEIDNDFSRFFDNISSTTTCHRRTRANNNKNNNFLIMDKSRLELLILYMASKIVNDKCGMSIFQCHFLRWLIMCHET